MVAHGSCYSNFLLCGSSIVLAVGCGIWFAFQFIWFGGCALGIIVVCITVVFFLFFNIVALLPLCNVNKFRPNATVFVVGFTSFYVVYLSWASMASHPNPVCNHLITSGVNTLLQIVVGTIFTFANIWSIAVASAAEGAVEKHSMGQTIVEETAFDSKPTTAENEDAALFPVTFQTMFFQGVMLLVSLYFGMLFSNWGYAILGDETDISSENAHFSVWAKLSVQWVTMILFTVSVTLYCCDPNRII